MFTGSCHCGSVHLTIPSAPDRLTNCNCSICWRYAALWAYFRADEVSIVCPPTQLESYSWGIRGLCFFRCRTCGVVTHWEKAQADADSLVGVNMRNFETTALAHARVVALDGRAIGPKHFDA
jgi:hypothetical protein